MNARQHTEHARMSDRRAARQAKQRREQKQLQERVIKEMDFIANSIAAVTHDMIRMDKFDDEAPNLLTSARLLVLSASRLQQRSK